MLYVLYNFDSKEYLKVGEDFLTFSLQEAVVFRSQEAAMDWRKNLEDEVRGLEVFTPYPVKLVHVSLT